MWTVTDRPNVSQWSQETGYDDEADENSYPIRVFGAKQNVALRFYLINEEGDIDTTICRAPGFRIYTHLAMYSAQKSEMIQLESLFLKGSILWIKPKMIIALNGLRSYSPDQRQCFFSTERISRFFKFHSQQSCEIECLANYTM